MLTVRSVAPVTTGDASCFNASRLSTNTSTTDFQYSMFSEAAACYDVQNCRSRDDH